MTNDEKRERNRLKVARWRARHANEMAAKNEMTSDRGAGGGRRPMHYVREYVHDGGQWDGLPAAVEIIRGAAVEVPAGLRLDSRWIPHWPMSLRMAKRVRSFRLKQVIAWCGGARPPWLVKSTL
jgi:hypothetical protein